jgi:hypothetical protein
LGNDIAWKEAALCKRYPCWVAVTNLQKKASGFATLAFEFTGKREAARLQQN